MTPEIRLLAWTLPALLSAACLIGCIAAWAVAASRPPENRSGAARVAWAALVGCVGFGIAAFALAGSLYSSDDAWTM